jgi:hypothetical protein
VEVRLVGARGVLVGDCPFEGRIIRPEVLFQLANKFAREYKPTVTVNCTR